MTAALIVIGFSLCVALVFAWAFRRPRVRVDDEIYLAPEAEASPHFRSIVTLREQTFEI